MKKRLHRKVVTYRHFADAHYISQIGKWWDELPTTSVTAIVEGVLKKAVNQCQNCRIIAFDLDRYDPKELFGPDGNEVWSYTNFEVDLVLRNQKLFAATRWYRHNREFSFDEAKAFWKPVRVALWSKARKIGYGP